MKCEELRTFVICLEKKADERCNVNMKGILSVFPKAQRTRAVDASTLRVDDSRISCYARYYIQTKKESDWMHLGNINAIGCYLSHIELWRRCVQLNEPIVIIEDDIHLTSQKSDQIREAVTSIPSDCDFAGIMHSNLFPHTNSKQCDGKWCDCSSHHIYMGLMMYCVTPRGARILLRDALPVVVHIDSYIGYITSVSEIKALYWKEQIYSLNDLLRDNYGSTLEHTFNIRKLLLPSSNTFYICFFILFLVLLIATISMSVSIAYK